MESVKVSSWRSKVALFTRAWIEILLYCAFSGLSMWSPFSRGRGLKLCLLCNSCLFCAVALFTRAWIEIKRIYLPLWLRITSPFSRGRGLKYDKHENADTDSKVALFTRAWIEIQSARSVNHICPGRPFHEGVD